MAAIRINRSAPFPARVTGTGLIDVVKTNGIWTVAVDFTNVADMVPITAQYPNAFLAYYNTATLAFGRMSLTELLQGAPINISSASPTAGIGYATGAGGTVTQITSKATGVTLSKVCGAITMQAASLAAGTIASFVLTNTAIAATDVLVLNHISGGTIGAYTLNAQAANGSATINVRNNTAGALAEAIVIQFAVIKGVNA